VGDRKGNREKEKKQGMEEGCEEVGKVWKGKSK
jgi:hypothetical protein